MTIRDAIKWALPEHDNLVAGGVQPPELLRLACLKVFEENISRDDDHVRALRMGLIDLNKKSAFKPDAEIDKDLDKRFEDLNGMRLRPNEKSVIKNLDDAWGQYLILPRLSQEEISDFRRSIDRCYDLIARRVAKRVDSDAWS